MGLPVAVPSSGSLTGSGFNMQGYLASLPAFPINPTGGGTSWYNPPTYGGSTLPGILSGGTVPLNAGTPVAAATLPPAGSTPAISSGLDTSFGGLLAANTNDFKNFTPPASTPDTFTGSSTPFDLSTDPNAFSDGSTTGTGAGSVAGGANNALSGTLATVFGSSTDPTTTPTSSTDGSTPTTSGVPSIASSCGTTGSGTVDSFLGAVGAFINTGNPFATSNCTVPAAGASTTNSGFWGNVLNDLGNFFVRGGIVLLAIIIIALALWAMLHKANIVAIGPAAAGHKLGRAVS